MHIPDSVSEVGIILSSVPYKLQTGVCTALLCDVATYAAFLLYPPVSACLLEAYAQGADTLTSSHTSRFEV